MKKICNIWGDVTQIIHQVHVYPRDHEVLRFLWFFWGKQIPNTVRNGFPEKLH